jgi:type II secretory pathway predicted ATPase ExeA
MVFKQWNKLLNARLDIQYSLKALKRDYHIPDDATKEIDDALEVIKKVMEDKNNAAEF